MSERGKELAEQFRSKLRRHRSSQAITNDMLIEAVGELSARIEKLEPAPADPWVCPDSGSTDWCSRCSEEDGHWPIRLSEYKARRKPHVGQAERHSDPHDYIGEP